MKIFRAKPLCWQYNSDVQLELVDRLFVKRESSMQGFYQGMFDEDFARLFNSSNRRNGDLFEIVSNDDELTEKLLSNVRTRHSPRLINEKIRELVEEIAQSLIQYGRAHYFLHDDTLQEKVSVASFSSSGVVSLFGAHIQWVPKRREKHWNRDAEEHPREIRILDAAKVMRFNMPTAIKRILSAQNKTLAVLDKHKFGTTDFHFQHSHESPNSANHFDFRVWNDSQDRILSRATRGTGWNARNYNSQKRSEFFMCHRLIRFRRKQLMLRDHILNQLSYELMRVGKIYNPEYSIDISGTDKLPSVVKLNELEIRLAREEIGFSEIRDYYYDC